MPGPPPKNPAIRQRRNKSATKALLPAEKTPILNPPNLPEFNPDFLWHELTRSWWVDVWNSPQRSEFLRADLGSLFRLAVLVNQFWFSFDLQIAKEIRLLEREFGLTPLARRRLEWTVAQTEDAKDRREISRAKRSKIIDMDPREVLE